MKGDDQNESKDQAVDRDVRVANVSTVLCVWVGLGVGVYLAWGKGFLWVLMGMLYGVLIGFFSYLFVLCVLFLVSLVLPKKGGALESGLTRIFILGAPAFAGWVVWVTGVRMF